MSVTHIIGQERIPQSGTLVVPGSLDVQDIQVLKKLFSSRGITWLVAEHAVIAPEIQNLVSSDHGAMISTDDDDPAAAGKQLKANLANNAVIIYIPGAVKARQALPNHIPAKVLQTICALGLPILPLVVDHPREGRYSFQDKSSLPAAALIFSPEIPVGKATPALLWESMLAAHEEGFSRRDFLNENLGMALLKGLKANGKSRKLFDGTDDSVLEYDKVLASAIVLSKVIREETEQKRVGIVLPPGKAGLIANVAVILAGKIPVNMNFTASQEAVRSAIRQSGIDRMITVDPFVRKFPSFPWMPNRDLILVERTLPKLKKKIAQWLIAVKFLPATTIAKLIRLPKFAPEDEAVLLFTSGSSGEPKGVPLSHKNVLANITQFHTRLMLPAGEKIFGSLPLFHSFGCTVTLWYPILAGLDLVTYPSPLESKRLAELIHNHNVAVLISTPTFLRGFMKRVDSEQLKALKLLVTGAEKLPDSFAQSFVEKFGILPLEGYGLTETSPATNVNLPDPVSENGLPVLASAAPNTVGQMLPGIAIRLTDPATEKPVPLTQQGLIWLKGANVFEGYLNNPNKTAEVLKDGWFLTGDVGRMDENGFLHIEGRISRFSKIGGEMVPHETLEAAINQCLALDQETERKIAVVGTPDEQKGEAIVLLSTIVGMAPEQECIDLRYKLMDAGIPSLWCPKRIIAVSEIPVLASGKLDIKACEALVR